MKLTYQQVFDKAYAGLKAQAFRKSSASGSCKYRMLYYDEILRCALGHLIPDELYDPTMEGSSPVPFKSGSDRQLAFEDIMGQVLGEMTKEDREFLAVLQSVHDDADYFNPTAMDSDLRDFARARGLTVEGSNP